MTVTPKVQDGVNVLLMMFVGLNIIAGDSHRHRVV